MDQPGEVANPARGQLNRENVSRSRLIIWSRKTDLAVPSRVSLLIFHTQAAPGAQSRDYSRFSQGCPFSYTTNDHGVSPEFMRSAIAYR